jgi:hypothetical protein
MRVQIRHPPLDAPERLPGVEIPGQIHPLA